MSQPVMPALAAFTISMTAIPAFAGTIDPALQVELEARPYALHNVLVSMVEQVDLVALESRFNAERAPLAIRHQETIESLQGLASFSQASLLQDLSAMTADTAPRMRQVAAIESYWLRNLVRVEATSDVIFEIAARSDVLEVHLNAPIELVQPFEGEPDSGSMGLGGVEPGVAEIQAPAAWAMGYDGTGALVAIVDTGADGNHESLASRWRGLDPAYAGNPQWAFDDPFQDPPDEDFPTDSGDHGTHCLGSIVGGAPGDSIGVAPGAEWIAGATIDQGGGIDQTLADAIETFEWVVDPDGDPSTMFDVPDVCSNSWGVTGFHGVPDCDNQLWSFIDAMETTGVVVVFAAGNEGPSSSTIRRPADRNTTAFTTLAVGAVDGNSGIDFPMASFSSRGPVYCNPFGQSGVKPDISAPGLEVRSANANGGYTEKSGTSMACPHIAGVVALMRGANPELPVQELKQIMFDTATDRGAPGKDNDYGWGVVNALLSVEGALETVSVQVELLTPIPELTDPFAGYPVVLSISDGDDIHDPSAVRMLANGASYPMTATQPGRYAGTVPGLGCGSEVQVAFEVGVFGSGDVVRYPSAGGFVTTQWSDVVAVVLDSGDTTNGWQVSGNATDGQWEQGAPIPSSVCSRGNPGQDADGTEGCWLTDNDSANACNSDVDSGNTVLTSPAFDLSLEGSVLSYARWLDNTVGSNPGTDALLVEWSTDGSSWNTLETFGPANAGGGWLRPEFVVGQDLPASSSMQLRFTVGDDDVVPSV
ncbi:MAG: S8 family serine peptidase, partial [Planctomycetota bacterium]|nr:S8 family serine peptidase [Planctomycetota bacterium]